jgi:hypothetical protein
MATKRKSTVAKNTNYDADYILEQLADGVTLREIGQGYGVNKHSVRQWMMRNHPKEYQTMMDTIADEIADEMVRVSYDEDIDIARSRNIINTLQFKLSRRHSNLYGDKVQQEITHKNGPVKPVINITLSAPASTVAIEGTVIEATPLPDTNKAIQGNE